jgi:predicted dehydrogenase
MNKRVRIGIIGGGFIAVQHYECIKRIYGIDIDVVGIYDTIAEKSERFAAERGIRIFSSIQDMIGDVDAVDICTPPYAHAEYIREAAAAGRHILCEKPLIGYAPPPGNEDFRGDCAPKAPMLDAVRSDLYGLARALSDSGVTFAYFENFIYAPQIQKEAEIIRKTGAQILRMTGEESHRGNHASYSSYWKYACGGSLISTGSHPLGAMLYLKRVEGEARGSGPIRPVSVSARVHGLTRISGYRNEGFLRCDYADVEDYAWAHVVFEDGTVGDVIAGATTLGGINDYVHVFANNHTSRCTINPAPLHDVYNPTGSNSGTSTSITAYPLRKGGCTRRPTRIGCSDTRPRCRTD